MAKETISVIGMTAPTFKRILKDIRNEEDPEGALDITGYTIKLIVKNSTDLPDARAHFSLTATIVTAASGLYSFAFTLAHTGLPAGTYPGEIRWWDGATTNPATDAIQVDFEVIQPVDDTV